MSFAGPFSLKSTMMRANFVSNVIGVSIVHVLSLTSSPPSSGETDRTLFAISATIIPVLFFAVMYITFLYERPIRRCLDMLADRTPVSEALLTDARKRLLNEPFVLIIVDMLTWITAAITFSAVFWVFDIEAVPTDRAFSLNIITGLITSIVAFFVLEGVLQRRMVPALFPKGGLYATPGTARIRIRTRLGAMVVVCNVIPFLTVMGSAFNLHRDPARMETFLLISSCVFIATGIWITIVVSSNLSRPLWNIIEVLQEVRKGNFDRKVRVTTNDEIGYAGDVINEMTEGLKERDFIKETFGRYVTQEIRDEILAGRIPLDGQLMEVTVLFADLRNFTPLVESTPPREVVSIINGYFRRMEEAINECHGLVLQYIGDEIEAVFGAPLPRTDHAEMAVRAALEMKKGISDVNAELAVLGYQPLFHGIGIHTGEVVAANIGSPTRMSYALVGETVNLASRLQDLNKEYGTEIIVSGATQSRLDNRFQLRSLPPSTVKGISRPVEIFALS